MENLVEFYTYEVCTDGETMETCYAIIDVANKMVLSVPEDPRNGHYRKILKSKENGIQAKSYEQFLIDVAALQNS